MSRPRESLLSLFDPLHGDVAADDGNLSDDYDSDKENSAPPAADMTMGTFFQSFKTSVPPQPKALNKRLVDIGDITVEEPSLVSVSEDDEDEAEFDDENNFFNLALAEQTPRPRPPPAVSAPPRPSPRTPFGELQVGPDATPVSSRRTVERQLFPRNGLTISPNKSSDGPLSSLVDSINAEGVSFSQLGLAKPRVPEITVSSPIATPFTAEFALSPRTTTRDDSLQSSLGANSSPRSNRLSLDLQASFQLHFDSPEDSFDLLNDKISFLGQTSRDHGSVSGDEDDYRLGLDTSEQPATSADVVVDSSSVSMLEEKSCSPELCLASPSRPSSALSVDLPEVTEDSLPANESLVEQMQPPTLFDEPQSDEEEIPVLPAPVPTKDIPVTPAPTKRTQIQAPPPVQALRIIKRPKPVMSTAAGRRLSARPVQPSEEKERSAARRPSMTATVSTLRATSSKPIASAPVVPNVNGPRRVPIVTAEHPHASTSDTSVSTRALPGHGLRRFVAADSGAQRTNIESVRQAINSIGAGQTKGSVSAKVARQIAAVPTAKESSRPAASTIPRPVSTTSRLPSHTFGFNRASKAVKPPTGPIRRV